MAKVKTPSPAPAKAGQATRAPRKSGAAKADPVSPGAPAVMEGATMQPPSTGEQQENLTVGAGASTATEQQGGSPISEPPTNDGGVPSLQGDAALLPGGATDPAGNPPPDDAALTGEAGGDQLPGDSGDLDALAKQADELQPELPLQALLVNGSGMAHCIPRARVKLEPGQSEVVQFRDQKHRDACERHVAQIRALYKWADGEGLRWEASQ